MLNRVFVGKAQSACSGPIMVPKGTMRKGKIPSVERTPEGVSVTFETKEKVPYFIPITQSVGKIVRGDTVSFLPVKQVENAEWESIYSHI